MKTRDNHPSIHADRPHLVEGGKVTHVLVPIDEYKRLIAESLLEKAVSKLSPETKWTNARDVGLRLAGKRVAAARKALKLTQKDLSRKLGVAQSEISRIENNPDNTTVKTLKRLAEALEVDVRALI